MNEDEALDLNAAFDRALLLLTRIGEALGTAETGFRLVVAAREAHRAEEDLAYYKKLARDSDSDDPIVQMLRR